MDPRLEQIFSLLPHRCNSIFIAGGAAVNFDLAGDVDLIFGGKNGLENAGKFWEAQPYKSAAKLGNYNKMHLLGDVYVPFLNKIVQVLWTNHKTALECMDDFDISTHRFAYTSKGDYVEGNGATSPTEPPQVFKSNGKTFARYIKICKRYNHPVDLSILEKLSSKVEVKTEKPKMEIPDWMAEYLKPMPLKTSTIAGHEVVEDFSKQFAQYLQQIYPPTKK